MRHRMTDPTITYENNSVHLRRHSVRWINLSWFSAHISFFNDALDILNGDNYLVICTYWNREYSVSKSISFAISKQIVIKGQRKKENGSHKVQSSCWGCLLNFQVAGSIEQSAVSSLLISVSSRDLYRHLFAIKITLSLKPIIFNLAICIS